MLDIHTHILPGVDDGAKSVEEALELINKEILCGVNTVVFTPHSICQNEIIKNKFLELEGLILAHNLNIKYYLGQEVYFTPDTITKLENNEYLSINNSKYVLIEFRHDVEAWELEDAIIGIRGIGYEPIIAHIERYDISFSDYKRIKDELKPLYQVNASLFINNRKLAKQYLKANLVDYIASDCHSIVARPPNLDKTEKIIKKYNLNIDRFN